ncbi:nitrite/sulfite reductase [Clostridium sp. DJ247]|uniref:nitrite/sulfite reductase n=1 Tax=Clostridium sp. DJ247 TaxID=2726188 RepID=UPI00162A0615|nr:nitrite/sulfite reductase [Clostridium sp. DJ247]MBC2580222.1 nitrite/sulfite reductase [Clostridium sp. DJ247]
MSNFKEILLNEIPAFNELGHKFLNGEVNRADFKGVSGGMGVYAHRSGTEFMVRLRVASGVLNREKLQLVYDLAKKYNLGGIHLTTRQAIQLHGLSIDEICEVIKEGIEKDMYTRGSGGNFPRNVAISPLSGVDPDEAFDVTPYALAVNEHFMKKIREYKLPRKLKVAFSSSTADFSHTTVTDQGFLAVKDNGKEYFKVYIGGGLGRNPKLAVQIEELVEPKDVLYHIEAITRLFMAEGDYTNKAKARIRYILDRMGKEEFINCYKKHLKEVIESESLELQVEQKTYNKEGIKTASKNTRLFAQKQDGLYSVYLHPVGGQLKLETLEMLLNEFKNIEDVEVRLAMTEGMYIRNLNGKEAEKILELTAGVGGETKLEQSVACIGVPTCQVGVLDGQSTLRETIKFFREKNFTSDVLPSIYISGCPNSCGVHEIGKIGFSGKMKKVNDASAQVFELHVGGDLGIEKTKLGTHYADILQAQVPEFLYELAQLVEKSSIEFDTWMNENQGAFKELVDRYAV